MKIRRMTIVAVGVLALAFTGVPALAATNARAAGPAADLQSGLTFLLTEHVYTAAGALQTAVAMGGNMDDPAVQAAVSTLDANSVALSEAVGSVYPEAEAPFLESWRQHIGFFVNYTLGVATGDTAMSDQAKADLDGYRVSFGQLINSVVPELPADAVAEELTPHVQSMLDYIDAMVAGDPSAYGLLSAAAAHMPHAATTLAGGIAANKGLS